MTRVALQNITMDYGGLAALQNFSLETEDGEFLVLLGPAGAGKTTTLKILAGLLKPTRGRVFFDGTDVTDVPANKRSVAMTFEDYALYPTFSVMENLLNPLKADRSSYSDKQARETIDRVTRMLKIEHLLERRADQLSGGQKQRVALARSLVREPALFLFDEPLSHVDAKIKHSMRAELHRLASLFSTTTVYVTHDYIEALALADRIVVIDKGVVQQTGTPHDVYNRPQNEFVARTVGQPTINLMPLRIDGKPDGLTLSGTGPPAFSFRPGSDHPLPDLTDHLGRECTVGVRPQDVGYGLRPDQVSPAAVECRVELVETWGHKMMILTTLGDVSLRILTKSIIDVHADQPIWIDLSGSPLHFFDGSGSRIE